MTTIVIQETDRDILDVLALAIEMEGFKVYTHTDERECFLKLIDQVSPNLVVLDFRLDGKQSIAMCHSIKRKHKHLPVIALSCNHNIHEKYGQHGFDDYIIKPFDLDVLYKTLRKYIPKQEA